ncbi:MAG TPA: deoxyribonuclease IV [Gemmatimonadaceae bacterium]|nr:deoxyribonuclease IV [Gemmatimonadaceae bacterium]
MTTTNSAAHYFGAHTIDNGGIHMAARRAGASKMRALQIFTAIPKYYGDKVSIKPERVERFRAALGEAKIDPRFVVAHAAYVLNTATPEEEKSRRARDGLAKELERSTALGIGAVCFHPGAATDDNREAAAERVASAIVNALEKVPNGATRLLVENTAGAGKTFAKTAAEVAAILRHVPATLRPRTGYGLDTCHLFSSGYDLRAGSGAVSRVIDEFEQATGERPGFFHLNDSEGELGSNKDRHMLIGEGRIGADAFRALVADPRSRGVPLILETPQQGTEIAEDDATPDPYDVRMMALLEGFAS